MASACAILRWIYKKSARLLMVIVLPSPRIQTSISNMKLILPTTLAVLASTAFAKNCNEGFDYCALTLLNNGDYHQQILQAMDDYGKNRANWNYDNFLYHCDGGSDGDIRITKECSNGCVDGGAGNSDQCK